MTTNTAITFDPSRVPKSAAEGFIGEKQSNGLWLFVHFPAYKLP